MEELSFDASRKMVRQGECLFIPVTKFLDKDDQYEVVPPAGNHLTVGHSESGHHHVIDVVRSPNAQLLIDKVNDCNGRLTLESDAELEHLKTASDKHVTVPLEKGDYVVRWEREHTPEGFQRVAD